MCVGGLFGGRPKMVQPQRQQTAPTMQAAAPPPEMVSPEKIKEEQTEDDVLSTKKRKALEIKKVKEGVKEFGAINPASLPDTPSGGVNTP